MDKELDRLELSLEQTLLPLYLNEEPQSRYWFDDNEEEYRDAFINVI